MGVYGLIGLLLVSMVALVGCAGSSTGQSEPSSYDASLNSAIDSSLTKRDSFWSQSATPFSGGALRGISEDSPPSLYVRDVLAPQFAEDTGLNVQLQITSNAEIEQIIENGGLGTDGTQYDFVYVEQDVIYGYLAQRRLTNLSQLLQENPHLASPDFALDDFTSFINAFVDPNSGDLFGMPIEAFIKVYLYRTDLFEDPALQVAFDRKYHYPLSPAVTFKQYGDIAEFFTEYGQVEQRDLWGTSLQASTTEIASFYEFFETIAPSFGLYNWGINLDSYRATEENGGALDSSRAVEALAYWVNLLAYAPPNATESDWGDVANTFAQGKVAQGWVYGEHVAWIAADRTRSKVVGHVGVTLPPTAPGVMEDASIGAGYIGYYDGAAFGIPIHSQNKEAALLWLQYVAQPNIQPEWAASSGRVVHLSTFDDPLVRDQDRLLSGYYGLMKKQGHLFSGAPPFPFHVQVRDIIAPYIQATIAGDLTPSEALSQAAAAVDDELVRLGYIRK
ncbi:MAG: extracellular solute-binding protein [Chloroflexota bacterium]